MRSAGSCARCQDLPSKWITPLGSLQAEQELNFLHNIWVSKHTPTTQLKKECALSYTVPQKSPTQGHIWPVIISCLFLFSLRSTLQKTTLPPKYSLSSQWVARFHKGGQTEEWSISYLGDQHTEKWQWLYVWSVVKHMVSQWSTQIMYVFCRGKKARCFTHPLS